MSKFANMLITQVNLKHNAQKIGYEELSQLPPFWNNIWWNFHNLIEFYDLQILQPKISQIVGHSDR